MGTKVLILGESGVDVNIAQYFDISVLLKDKDTQEVLGNMSDLTKELQLLHFRLLR